MTAIKIGPTGPPDIDDDENWMPLSTRILVARELNRLWAEFVTDMHSGPLTDSDVPSKFWKFVTSRA